MAETRNQISNYLWVVQKYTKAKLEVDQNHTHTQNDSSGFIFIEMAYELGLLYIIWQKYEIKLQQWKSNTMKG